jgi:hypothetical protein
MTCALVIGHHTNPCLSLGAHAYPRLGDVPLPRQCHAPPLFVWEMCYYSCNVMYRSFDRNLACGDETNLDRYRVMATSGDLGMAIIIMSNHYSMLSCQPTPPLEALYALSERCADSGGSVILYVPCPVGAWVSRCPGLRLLVGLRCMSTCDAVRSDPNTD